jgi:hypothetical protein
MVGMPGASFFQGQTQVESRIQFIPNPLVQSVLGAADGQRRAGGEALRSKPSAKPAYPIGYVKRQLNSTILMFDQTDGRRGEHNDYTEK